MNIYEKLAAVQQELKAPKDKKNTFAGYSYRSAEGILEAAKPVLKKYGATIILGDTIKEIGGRIYVEATAEFLDTEHIFEDTEKRMMNLIEVTAYAREAETKKGLDDSQITGTASSYARKYALNGLLLIDDTKDADTDEYQKQTGAEEKQINKVIVSKATDKITTETVELIKRLATDAKVDLQTVLMKPVEQLTNKQAEALITSLKKKIGG